MDGWDREHSTAKQEKDCSRLYIVDIFRINRHGQWESRVEAINLSLRLEQLIISSALNLIISDMILYLI